MTTAQPGRNTVLNYRPQPAQAQPGRGTVLEYAATAAGTMVRAVMVAPWSQSSATARTRVAAVHPPAIATDRRASAPWRRAAPQATPTRSAWVASAARDRATRAPWGRYGLHAVTPVQAPHPASAPRDVGAIAPWGRYGLHAVTPVEAPHPAAIARDTTTRAPWGTYTPRRTPLAVLIHAAANADRAYIVPWGRYTRPLSPVWGVVTPPDETPTDENGTVIVPILGAYIVINEVSLTRVSDGAALGASNLTASLDVQSWTWGWSANIPAAELDLVRPAAPGELVEVLASINGIPLRLVVEQIARDRRFADAKLRIGGRGRAAWLADPHSPIQTRYNTQARTAAQLLDDALTLNNVSIGWTVDWQATDWLVPAGAWSHTGTYIDAAKRLAEAAGAYVQAHDTDQTLHILPWYPAKPWDWSTTTPDIEIPEDVCEVEGIEWLDKPRYNAVYVIGGKDGRRDRIKRAGSAADHYAPTIVDPLATAPEMTLARGGQALADTGRQAHITLRLPVLPETGIIKPGQLIRYQEQGNTHLGLTRSVSLQHDFPQLWQTIKIETHELEAP